MKELVRFHLCDLIATHGRPVVGDARRCEMELHSRCPSGQREVRLLIDGLQARIPQQLTESRGDQPWEWILQPLVRELVDFQGMRAKDAKWVVETWSMAIGKPDRRPPERARGEIQVSPPASKTAAGRAKAILFFPLIPERRKQNSQLATWVLTFAVVAALFGMIIGLSRRGLAGMGFGLLFGGIGGTVVGFVAGSIWIGHHWLLKRASMEWVILGALLGALVGWSLDLKGVLGGHWLHLGAIGGAVLSIILKSLAQRRAAEETRG